MTSDRQRPFPAFWITVALVTVLVGYPLSFGPACWIVSCMGGGDLTLVYRPWLNAASRSQTAKSTLHLYANCLSASDGYWDLDKFGRFAWWQR